MKGVSQQLQFNHYCGLFITSFISAFRDLNFMLPLCVVIKFRAGLMTEPVPSDRNLPATPQ